MGLMAELNPPPAVACSLPAVENDETSNVPAVTGETMPAMPDESTPARANGAAAWSAGAVKIYGEGDTEVRALDGISVEFQTGELTAVMGPSGSGKSTLMHCMAGLDTPTQGEVFVEGVSLGTLSERQLTLLRRNRIGFVFQAFNLVPTLNAEENITLPSQLGGTDIDKKWFDEIVQAVGLADRLSHRPTELSGGQQQRVAVARALASQPAIVFADEPTGNLDSKTGGEILSFIRQAVDQLNQTVVMVTHDANTAAYSDRVVFLVDGQIVKELASPNADDVLDTIKSLDD